MSELRKKRVLISGNYCGLKTGFGGFMRELLTYLYKTGKYELHLLAGAVTEGYPEFSKWPWKCHGALPNTPQELQSLQADERTFKLANYGDYRANDVVKAVKPDVFIGVEDIWGLAFFKDKPWWNKIPCVVHTTLDSRPILEMAFELAKATPYFFSWADFATKDMNARGQTHVKTLRGSVNSGAFFKLNRSVREELRHRYGISPSDFCVGMCSRNQLRKSFPQLIEGFADFKKKNPKKNAKLLLHTHWGEGWDLPPLIKQNGLNESDVLATYKCRSTGRMYILPYAGQDLDNPETGHKNSLVTVNIKDGVTESQLNEWYNLLDVYAHAFTSGGQERTIQEAKLAELVTLVTNYSCGEDNCEEGAASIPLEFSSYREGVSSFIKANTSVYSISSSLKKVSDMALEKREAMGKKARQWVLENFSIEKIGQQFEQLLDSFPLSDYDFDFSVKPKNPSAVIEDSTDDRIWVKSLYSKILNMEVADDDEGVKYWMSELAKNVPRQNVENYFRHIAEQENDKLKKNSSELDSLEGLPENRVLINIPESLGDALYITALLEDAKNNVYVGKDIYIATKPKFREVFEPLVGTLIKRVLEWQPAYDNSMQLEGYNGNKTFQVVLQPHFFTQRMINYLHNGETTNHLQLTLP